MARKEPRSARETSSQHNSQERGNRERDHSRDNRSRFAPQARQGSEWREIDRPSGGRDPREEEMGRRGSRESNNGGFPIDNLVYDVITVLHEKSKGLEAFHRYQQDARGDEVEDLLHEIREQDERAIEELQDHLHRLLNESGRGHRAA